MNAWEALLLSACILNMVYLGRTLILIMLNIHKIICDDSFFSSIAETKDGSRQKIDSSDISPKAPKNTMAAVSVSLKSKFSLFSTRPVKSSQEIDPMKSCATRYKQLASVHEKSIFFNPEKSNFGTEVRKSYMPKKHSVVVRLVLFQGNRLPQGASWKYHRQPC